MKDFKTFVGIDVSKDTLAFSIYDGKEHIVKEIKYTKAVITKELIKPFKDKKDLVLFVMEATGIYHNKLANLLYKEGLAVSVVNPFAIKSYAKSRLKRVKTDKSDSKLIAEFAYIFSRDLTLYKPKDKEQKEIDDILKSIDDINLINTTLTNQIKALKEQDRYSKDIVKLKEELLKKNNQVKERLKKLLDKKLKESFTKEYKLLKAIPGVGLMVSGSIISIFNAFKEFDSAKRACSFIGIAPAPYESGSSVKRRGSISKRGNPLIRKILYMATLSAIKHNKTVKEFYERLLQKGKTKMVALIAAMNKLLRIIFAVVKHKREFCENYVRA